MKKSIVIVVSYEGLDNEVVEMVPENNDSNNYYDVVSDSDSDKEAEKEEDFEPEIDDKLEVTLKATQHPKVVKAMKKLQAFFNEDETKSWNSLNEKRL